MNWPNRIPVPLPSGNLKKYNEGIGLMYDLSKWCADTLSSKGVLWEKEINTEDNTMDFYFAQPQDAILFRLTHGV